MNSIPLKAPTSIERSGRRADITRARIGYHLELTDRDAWTHVRGGRWTLTLWGATRVAFRWIRHLTGRTEAMKVFRDTNEHLDAVRIGRVIFEFNRHDAWLPIYAKRLFRVGRFQIWCDRQQKGSRA